MSISGEQNNPYGQPPPQQPQPNPYGQAPAAQNPYVQQPPPQGLGGYVHPAPGTAGTPIGGAGAVTPAPPMGAPGALGADTGRGASGWPWAIGGAVAASAMWASVMFATGAFSSEPSPDLAGYSYTSDLCAATSLTPFKDAHYRTKQNTGTASKDPNPKHSGAQAKSMDTMWCNISMEQENASSSGYSSTWVYNTATLHKKSDPAPEFADGYRAYEKQDVSAGYQVEPVAGIGDEAYLVTRKDGGSSSSYVSLGVRDGWMTYQSTWSSYASTSGTAKQPTSGEVATMLKNSATETLKQLRGSGAR